MYILLFKLFDLLFILYIDWPVIVTFLDHDDSFVTEIDV